MTTKMTTKMIRKAIGYCLLAGVWLLGMPAPALTAGNGFVDASGNAFDGNAIMCVTGAVLGGKQVVAPCGSATNPLPVVAAPGTGSFGSPAPVTVGTTATLIVAARTGAAGVGRVAVTVTCGAAVAIGMTNAVTFAGAGQIPANGALTLNTTAAVYGIVGSSTTTCNVWETF